MNAVATDTELDSSEDSASAPAAGATSASKRGRPKKEKEVEVVVPDPARDESQRIEPEPTGPIYLESGLEVEIQPLRLRETMKLLKIVTRGAGGILEQLVGDLDMENPEAFAQTFGALILMSIPEAENEAVEFIQSMVVPAGFNKLSREEQLEQLNAVTTELINPSLSDTVDIIERIVRRESEDIRSLGKKITTAFKMTSKVAPKSPDPR